MFVGDLNSNKDIQLIAKSSCNAAIEFQVLSGITGAIGHALSFYIHLHMQQTEEEIASLLRNSYPVIELFLLVDK